MKYIAGGQDYRKVLASQLSEEVNGSGGPTLGEAERTAGEKGQVEVEARGLGQTMGGGQKAEEGRFRRFGGVVPRQGLSEPGNETGQVRLTYGVGKTESHGTEEQVTVALEGLV